ncbi:MAG TPA: NAD(P)-dependent alcohol dehydrogenase [Solimonas sp.]|nr:NAD(P)-dependent alcohol dehydrogenase [Solimonas sp.]
MDILAAVSRVPKQPFSIETLRLDDPREDEVRVRIAGVGLCHTDLVGAAGALPLRLPAVFGHEGAGIIEATGRAVTKVKPGDRVVMSFRSCGECPQCRRQDPAYCRDAAQLNYRGCRVDGSATLVDAAGPLSGSFFGQSSFATHALASERNLVKIPDAMPLEISGTLGCGVQTGAGAVMRSLACRAGSSLLVLGGGAVGLSAVLGAVVQGCRQIVVVEPHVSRRELALQLGATQAIDPAAGELAGLLKAACAGGFDYALDTTGIPAVIEAAAGRLAGHAAFGFVAIPRPEDAAAKLPLNLSQLMLRGLSFKGILEGDSDLDTFIPQLCELHLAGRFPFDKLVTRYPLAEINRAVAEQHAGSCVKAVLLP